MTQPLIFFFNISINCKQIETANLFNDWAKQEKSLYLQGLMNERK